MKKFLLLFALVYLPSCTFAPTENVQELRMKATIMHSEAFLLEFRADMLELEHERARHKDRVQLKAAAFNAREAAKAEVFRITRDEDP